MSNSPYFLSERPIIQKEYSLFWEDWLGTDTISSSTWTAPTGMTIVTSTKTTTTTTVWLSGGVAGNTYSLVNRIVTAGGRTEERAIHITIART